MTRPLRKFNDCDKVDDCRDVLKAYEVNIAQTNWEITSIKERMNKHSLEYKEGVSKILNCLEDNNRKLLHLEKTFYDCRLQDTKIYAEDNKKIWDAINQNKYKMILLISFSGGSGAFAIYKVWSSISGLFA